MLVVDLVCAAGHGFEGWFQSADDLNSQQTRGLLTCPVCGHHEVVRRPSATRYNRSGVGEADPSTGHELIPSSPKTALNPDVSAALSQLQAAYTNAVREVLKSTEDVGDRFPDEARKIHQGDEPARAIRGHASVEEAQALQDEGIDVMSFLIPEELKRPLQ